MGYCEREALAARDCGELTAGSQMWVGWEKIIYKHWERVFDLQLSIWSDEPDMGLAMCIVGRVNLDELERRPKGEGGVGEGSKELR